MANVACEKERKIDLQQLFSVQDELEPKVKLRALKESQILIMQSKIGTYDQDKESADILQISVGNDCKLYDLTSKILKEVWFLEDVDRFGGDFENYVETGFNLIFTDSNGTENLVQPNDKFTAYSVKNDLLDNKAIIYRCCDEIDMNQVHVFNEAITNNLPIDDIFEEKSLLTSFGHHTFFSIFYHSEAVYNSIWDHLESKFEVENQGVIQTATDNKLFANRLLRVLEYPTKDLDYEEKETKRNLKERCAIALNAIKDFFSCRRKIKF